MRRRMSRLRYDVPPAVGLAAVEEALTRMLSNRVSVSEWRRRCETSLWASRARRRRG